MPEALYFTESQEANELIAREPLALLIGFALDQQVTVPTAFSGPLKLQQRIGELDATRIAAMDPAELEEAFRQKPAIHRFPGAMAFRSPCTSPIAFTAPGLVVKSSISSFSRNWPPGTVNAAP